MGNIKGSKNKTYRGREIRQDPAGIDWRERDFRAKALQREQEIRVRQGQLVERAEVEAGHAEMRDVIRSDLLGTLPLRVADTLAGKNMDAHGVRAAVLEAVREILAAWHKAGIPSPEET